jgi:hypothetical protein
MLARMWRKESFCPPLVGKKIKHHMEISMEIPQKKKGKENPTENRNTI